MLSTEALRLVAADLAFLDVPIVSRPRYGEDGAKDYDWYVRNRPNGWINLLAAFSLGTQGYFVDWTVTIEACAVRIADAEALAARIDHGLSHRSRLPTNYEFMSDQIARDPKSAKYVLTFIAHLRQGD